MSSELVGAADLETCLTLSNFFNIFSYTFSERKASMHLIISGHNSYNRDFL